MTGGTAFLSCLLLLGAAPEAVPRIVLLLQKPALGKVAVDVENAGSRPLVLAARTYLVLLDAPSDRPQAPRYWAELNVPGLPSSAAPMKMTARQRVRLPLDPGGASWAPDRTGISPGHSLAHAVPPGAYELQVQIVDERGAWWVSSGLPVTVSRGGGLTY
jgi:hypothetical protein